LRPIVSPLPPPPLAAAATNTTTTTTTVNYRRWKVLIRVVQLVEQCSMNVPKQLVKDVHPMPRYDLLLPPPSLLLALLLVLLLVLLS